MTHHVMRNRFFRQMRTKGANLMNIYAFRCLPCEQLHVSALLAHATPTVNILDEIL